MDEDEIFGFISLLNLTERKVGFTGWHLNGYYLDQNHFYFRFDESSCISDSDTNCKAVCVPV